MKLAIPALSLSLFLSLAGSARALVWSDDFNDGIVNPSLWTLSTSGGVSAKEENGRFWMHLPSDATGSTFAANLTAQPKLVGDFEILMDFSLDQWSSSSGVRLGLVVQFQYGGIGLVRYNNGPGSAEMYAMDFGNWWNGFNTVDRTGRFRWTRTGNLVMGQVDQNGSWVTVGFWGLASTEDVSFWIGAWSHDSYFGDQDTTVSIDNVHVQDSAVPEPSTCLGLLGGATYLVSKWSASKVKRR